MSRSNPHHAANPPSAAPHPLRGTALTFGLIGAVMASVATVMVVWGSSDLGSPAVGVLMRVAGILLAVSLVLPSLQKPSMTTLLVAGGGLVLILLRPGLIWVAALGWVGWALFVRQTSTADKDS